MLVMPEVLKDLQELVDYLYEEEATDFEEFMTEETNASPAVLEEMALAPVDGPRRQHIFRVIVRVKRWLKELGS